jgi:hypothetical protein
MKVDGDYVFFSSGKVCYANNGIIGLSESDEYGWHVSEGYDGSINVGQFTKAEKIELSDYMINLWQKFKNEA